MKILRSPRLGRAALPTLMLSLMPVMGIAAAAPASAANCQAVGPNAVSTDAVHPDAAVNTIYRDSYNDTYIKNPSDRVYGASGGTLTYSKGTSYQISGSLQSTTSADAGVVFAQVSQAVSVTVGASATTTTTVSYSWTVPSNQSQGWIEMGSHGYNISWSKGYYGGTGCAWHQQGSGSLLGATPNAAFQHS